MAQEQPQECSPERPQGEGHKSQQRSKSPVPRNNRKSPLPTRSFLSQAIVTAAVEGIENNVARLLRDSCYFQKLEENKNNGTSGSFDDDIIPLFHRKEIKVGRLLGKGSFANVCAIRDITLFEDPLQSSISSLNNGSISSLNNCCGSFEELSEEQQERRRTLRDNVASKKTKYAIKYLKKKLLKNPKGFVHAAADLVTEARFLSTLDHPNILKIRGMTLGGMKSFNSGGYDSYFIIIDRLQETLDRVIDDWSMFHGDDDGLDGDDPMEGKEMHHKLMARKINYAIQIGRALEYLHERRIIFRDLKPQNIGFTDEQHTTVQLFDFGLCRDLPRSKKKNGTNSENECFKMSGAGTRSYMAPEIINVRMYNLKADVYSWAMVFFEMITLARPYGTMDKETHEMQVCCRGQRPTIHEELGIPSSVQDVLTAAWHQDYTERPRMHTVCQQLQPIYEEQIQITKDLAEQRRQNSAKLNENDENDDDDSIIAIELEDCLCNLPGNVMQRYGDGHNSLESFNSSFGAGSSVSSIDFDTRGVFDGQEEQQLLE